MSAWREELADDYDAPFILQSIGNGFDIVDPSAVPEIVEIDNNFSAQPHSKLYDQATTQIISEIEQGNYEICTQNNKPAIISPLSVIEKPQGGVRIIHDGSQPAGLSMNDYATSDSNLRFQRVDDAAKLMKRHHFMANVDLKSAYRSVDISKHSQQFTGLKWQMGEESLYLKDTKLPFGSRLAPMIFHRLAQSVRRMTARKGFPYIVAYLDDFLIIAPSLDECQAALNILLRLLRKLGFQINRLKVVDPTRSLVFLGIQLDTIEMTMCIPYSKLMQIKEELALFSTWRRASKRQLQSLIGLLNWAASVVFGGRVFLRRLIDVLRTLNGKKDRLRLSAEILEDIQWWITYINNFNGK